MPSYGNGELGTQFLQKGPKTRGIRGNNDSVGGNRGQLRKNASQIQGIRSNSWNREQHESSQNLRTWTESLGRIEGTEQGYKRIQAAIKAKDKSVVLSKYAGLFSTGFAFKAKQYKSLVIWLGSGTLTDENEGPTLQSKLNAIQQGNPAAETLRDGIQEDVGELAAHSCPLERKGNHRAPNQQKDMFKWSATDIRLDHYAQENCLKYLAERDRTLIISSVEKGHFPSFLFGTEHGLELKRLNGARRVDYHRVNRTSQRDKCTASIEYTSLIGLQNYALRVSGVLASFRDIDFNGGQASKTAIDQIRNPARQYQGTDVKVSGPTPPTESTKIQNFFGSFGKEIEEHTILIISSENQGPESAFLFGGFGGLEGFWGWIRGVELKGLSRATSVYRRRSKRRVVEGEVLSIAAHWWSKTTKQYKSLVIWLGSGTLTDENEGPTLQSKLNAIQQGNPAAETLSKAMLGLRDGIQEDVGELAAHSCPLERKGNHRAPNQQKDMFKWSATDIRLDHYAQENCLKYLAERDRTLIISSVEKGHFPSFLFGTEHGLELKRLNGARRVDYHRVNRTSQRGQASKTAIDQIRNPARQYQGTDVKVELKGLSRATSVYRRRSKRRVVEGEVLSIAAHWWSKTKHAIQQGNAGVRDGIQEDVGELAAHSCPLERKGNHRAPNQQKDMFKWSATDIRLDHYAQENCLKYLAERDRTLIISSVEKGAFSIFPFWDGTWGDKHRKLQLIKYGIQQGNTKAQTLSFGKEIEEHTILIISSENQGPESAFLFGGFGGLEGFWGWIRGVELKGLSRATSVYRRRSKRRVVEGEVLSIAAHWWSKTTKQYKSLVIWLGSGTLTDENEGPTLQSKLNAIQQGNPAAETLRKFFGLFGMKTLEHAIQQGNAGVRDGIQEDVGELAAHSCPLERKGNHRAPNQQKDMFKWERNRYKAGPLCTRELSEVPRRERPNPNNLIRGKGGIFHLSFLGRNMGDKHRKLQLIKYGIQQGNTKAQTLSFGKEIEEHTILIISSENQGPESAFLFGGFGGLEGFWGWIRGVELKGLSRATSVYRRRSKRRVVEGEVLSIAAHWWSKTTKQYKSLVIWLGSGTLTDENEGPTLQSKLNAIQQGNPAAETLRDGIQEDVGELAAHSCPLERKGNHRAPNQQKDMFKWSATDIRLDHYAQENCLKYLAERDRTLIISSVEKGHFPSFLFGTEHGLELKRLNGARRVDYHRVNRTSQRDKCTASIEYTSLIGLQNYALRVSGVLASFRDIDFNGGQASKTAIDQIRNPARQYQGTDVKVSGPTPPTESTKIQNFFGSFGKEIEEHTILIISSENQGPESAFLFGGFGGLEGFWGWIRGVELKGLSRATSVYRRRSKRRVVEGEVLSIAAHWWSKTTKQYKSLVIWLGSGTSTDENEGPTLQSKLNAIQQGNPAAETLRDGIQEDVGELAAHSCPLERKGNHRAPNQQKDMFKWSATDIRLDHYAQENCLKYLAERDRTLIISSVEKGHFPSFLFGTEHGLELKRLNGARRVDYHRVNRTSQRDKCTASIEYTSLIGLQNYALRVSGVLASFRDIDFNGGQASKTAIDQIRNPARQYQGTDVKVSGPTPPTESTKIQNFFGSFGKEIEEHTILIISSENQGPESAFLFGGFGGLEGFWGWIRGVELKGLSRATSVYRRRSKRRVVEGEVLSIAAHWWSKTTKQYKSLVIWLGSGTLTDENEGPTLQSKLNAIQQGNPAAETLRDGIQEDVGELAAHSCPLERKGNHRAPNQQKDMFKWSATDIRLDHYAQENCLKYLAERDRTLIISSVEKGHFPSFLFGTEHGLELKRLNGARRVDYHRVNRTSQRDKCTASIEYTSLIGLQNYALRVSGVLASFRDIDFNGGQASKTAIDQIRNPARQYQGTDVKVSGPTPPTESTKIQNFFGSFGKEIEEHTILIISSENQGPESAFLFGGFGGLEGFWGWIRGVELKGLSRATSVYRRRSKRRVVEGEVLSIAAHWWSKTTKQYKSLVIWLGSGTLTDENEGPTLQSKLNAIQQGNPAAETLRDGIQEDVGELAAHSCPLERKGNHRAPNQQKDMFKWSATDIRLDHYAQENCLKYLAERDRTLIISSVEKGHFPSFLFGTEHGLELKRLNGARRVDYHRVNRTSQRDKCTASIEYTSLIGLQNYALRVSGVLASFRDIDFNGGQASKTAIDQIRNPARQYQGTDVKVSGPTPPTESTKIQNFFGSFGKEIEEHTILIISSENQGPESAFLFGGFGGLEGFWGWIRGVELKGLSRATSVYRRRSKRRVVEGEVLSIAAHWWSKTTKQYKSLVIWLGSGTLTDENEGPTLQSKLNAIQQGNPAAETLRDGIQEDVGELAAHSCPLERKGNHRAPNQQKDMFKWSATDIRLDHYAQENCLKYLAERDRTLIISSVEKGHFPSFLFGTEHGLELKRLNGARRVDYHRVNRTSQRDKCTASIEYTSLIGLQNYALRVSGVLASFRDIDFNGGQASKTAIDQIRNPARQYQGTDVKVSGPTPPTESTKIQNFFGSFGKEIEEHTILIISSENQGPESAFLFGGFGGLEGFWGWIRGVELKGLSRATSVYRRRSKRRVVEGEVLSIAAHWWSKTTKQYKSLVIWLGSGTLTDENEGPTLQSKLNAIQQGNPAAETLRDGIQEDVGELAAHSCPLERKGNHRAPNQQKDMFKWSATDIRLDHYAQENCLKYLAERDRTLIISSVVKGHFPSFLFGTEHGLELKRLNGARRVDYHRVNRTSQRDKCTASIEYTSLIGLQNYALRVSGVLASFRDIDFNGGQASKTAIDQIRNPARQYQGTDVKVSGPTPPTESTKIQNFFGSFGKEIEEHTILIISSENQGPESAFLFGGFGGLEGFWGWIRGVELKGLSRATSVYRRRSKRRVVEGEVLSIAAHWWSKTTKQYKSLVIWLGSGTLTDENEGPTLQSKLNAIQQGNPAAETLRDGIQEDVGELAAHSCPLERKGNHRAPNQQKDMFKWSATDIRLDHYAQENCLKYLAERDRTLIISSVEKGHFPSFLFGTEHGLELKRLNGARRVDYHRVNRTSQRDKCTASIEYTSLIGLQNYALRVSGVLASFRDIDFNGGQASKTAIDQIRNPIYFPNATASCEWLSAFSEPFSEQLIGILRSGGLSNAHLSYNELRPSGRCRALLAIFPGNPLTDSVKEGPETAELSPRLTPWEGIQPKIVIHPLKPPEFTPRTGIQPNRINIPQLSA
ncbi:hypothetical protein R3P38DRAFT_2770881 [Favolaschia claudopus]|uniref:Uncharacterized protein n=1 Tax=Favolaschia claudopus TaxID=2862362 RepID=A0AAW0CIK1_9AGAR